MRNSYLDVIGASNLLDRYYDQAHQLDISMNQKRRAISASTSRR
jgi:hypothetical protein